MRVNEYGVIFRLDVNFNISGFSSLSLVFTKTDETTLTKTDANVTVGSSDLETDQGTFKANEYLEYTFQNGDVDQAGGWTAQLTYTDASKSLISDKAKFNVAA